MNNDHLTVIILAAGHGTRMKSRRLKLLHEAAGLPLISHVRHVAESLNPQTIAFVVAPGMDDLNDALSPYKTIVQSPAKGTGHAVQVAMKDLGPLDGFVLVMLGDSPLVTTQDARHLIEACMAPDVDAAYLVADVSNPYGYGRMVTDGRILHRIVEEADASENEKAITLVNGGMVAFRADALRAHIGNLSDDNAQGELYLTQLPDLIGAAGRHCVVVKTRPENILGVNNRAQLAAIEAVLQARLRAFALSEGVTLKDPHTTHLSMDTVFARDVVIEPNVVIGRGVTLHEGVTVKSFSYLEDVILHDDVIVGPFARIRGGSVLEEGAEIGNFVEVARSSLGRKTKAKHLAYLGDTTTGNAVNIGAGTITCNYDGAQKHKTVMGDHVFVGSNSTIVAPSVLGNDAYIAAGSVITEGVPDGALGLGRARQENKTGWSARKRKPKGL